MRFPAVVLLLLLPGCVSQRRQEPDGPLHPARVRTEPWTFRGEAGKKLLTPHYLIYTTVGDEEVLASIGQVMEGALSQYHRLSPAVELTGQPMACYLFRTRDQWAEFTRGRTGADAAIYLRINRGGYTVRDWYVAYHIGDIGTYSVAAHEGFHQYVARHFRSRLPPFLEEGLACMFEEVRWESVRGRGPLPRWNFASNGSRMSGLRNAMEGGYLIPLSRLAAMHAGQIVDSSPKEIEAFYAQSWAFARFLWEAEGGRYRKALRRILTQAADGSLFPGARSHRTPDGLWDPDSASPLLEHYLSSSLTSIDAAFRRYVLKLLADQRPPPQE